MARCNCNPDNVPCLSNQAGNSLSLDANNCLFATSESPAVFGEAQLSTTMDGLAAAENTWTSLPLTVTLPGAGTYWVAGSTSMQLTVNFNVTTPGTAVASARVDFRIFDTTSGGIPLGATREVTMVGSTISGRFTDAGSATSHGIAVVTTPRVYTLQYRRLTVTQAGMTTTPVALNILGGLTNLNFFKIGS